MDTPTRIQTCYSITSNLNLTLTTDSHQHLARHLSRSRSFTFRPGLQLITISKRLCRCPPVSFAIPTTGPLFSVIFFHHHSEGSTHLFCRSNFSFTSSDLRFYLYWLQSFIGLSFLCHFSSDVISTFLIFWIIFDLIIYIYLHIIFGCRDCVFVIKVDWGFFRLLCGAVVIYGLIQYKNRLLFLLSVSNWFTNNVLYTPRTPELIYTRDA